MTGPGGCERAVGDPVGLITELVAAAEPGLAPEQIRAVVTAVAGGRAKSRRLASALAGRPAVLADGRSPAPRAVGDLLLALRQAGARSVSPPRCARCGKPLRTFRRRGQDWYCAPCGQRGRTVRRVREGPPGLLPGPGRAAAMLQVPGRRRPRSGHRDLRHHHRAGPCGQPGRGRRRRPPLGSPALIPAETGLGAGGQPAVADRGRSSGAGAGDPAAGRRAARRRRGRDHPSCLPRLSPGGAHRQAAGWRAGLPDLRRALSRRAMRTLRSPPRARHPR